MEDEKTFEKKFHNMNFVCKVFVWSESPILAYEIKYFLKDNYRIGLKSAVHLTELTCDFAEFNELGALFEPELEDFLLEYFPRCYIKKYPEYPIGIPKEKIKNWENNWYKMITLI
jgi:hypothetical protein